jgi:hypothetical protein
MSDQPTEAQQPVTDALPEPGMTPPGPGWFQRLSSVLFIIFCFELGLFLLIYPWTEGWSDNYFAWVVGGSGQPVWHSFWNNSFVRGAISGLGIVNLWIAVAEVFRMFSRRTKPRT